MAKAAGTSRFAHAPCCDLYERQEADALFCGEWDMPFEVVSPGQSSSQSGDLEREFFSGRSDFLAHVGGNGYSCTRAGWVDEYVWEPARCLSPTPQPRRCKGGSQPPPPPSLTPTHHPRCELATWDASAFCEALGGRSLLFLGDSTMRQVGVFFLVVTLDTGPRWALTP